MDAYDLYKPLRNSLRQLPLLESLGVVRAYLQHLQFNQPFPRDIEVDRQFLLAPTKVQKHVFEWELETLAKECILNCSDNGTRDLRRWREFSAAINKLKDLENEISKRYHPLFSRNILLELYRIAHRQFPWQQLPNSRTLTRYYKIFGHPKLDAIVKARTGLSAAELYTLGLLFTGFYLDKFGLDAPITVDIPDVTKEQIDAFIGHFATELPSLRIRIADAQTYDQDYAYTFNPLKIHPLVWVELRGKHTLIAPVPTYLFRRFTEGVYYEICDAPGFAAPFGSSFEDYVGAVVKAAGGQGTFEILPQQQYYVGKDRKDSVDWIVSDNTADLFVECKTKKLRYAAKIGLASTDVLDEDLEKMASFVVQTYKTVTDAQSGLYPHWRPRERPLYPVIVTLEEWYAFGDRIISAIDERVCDGLAKNSIDPRMLETHPYTICAVADFERAIQVMAQPGGIGRVMARKTSKEHRLWALHSVLTDSFGADLSSVDRNLFPDDFERIHST